MEDYNYEYEQENPTPKKTIRGYQIIIVVLAVILGALSFIYFRQMNTLKQEYAIERDTLTSQFASLLGQYDDLKTENDTIAYNLGIEREKADSLLQRLTSERSLSASKIRQYERELGTMRTAMKGFIHQIDSLNTLNKSLIAQNTEYRQQVTSQRLRADKAEETADELKIKVQQGSVLYVRDIRLNFLNNRDNVVTRAARATRLRVDCIISANPLATPGERNIYIRITGPDGYLLTHSGGGMFTYEGESRSYSATREVDYQNQDLPASVYCESSGITAGLYKVEVYLDGYLAGRTEISTK